jgi:hypothetical protein
MNLQTSGPARPKLWPPRALLSTAPDMPAAPILTGPELRRIVAERIG